MLPDILEDTTWQMSPGERAAIKGILAELAPEVAIEIGTAQGGSLRRIAEYAEHVHAFDTSEPPAELTILSNVTFHIGDSHELLPRVLMRLAEKATNVAFVLVDGDHFAEGVKRDIEDLLASPALSRTLIIVHDTANPEVRAGLDAIDYAAWPKLSWVDLDWIPGFVFRDGPSNGTAWAGLGLILLDAEHGPAAGPALVAHYAYPPGAQVNGQDADELRRRIASLECSLTALTMSRSWRLTRPFRALRKVLGQ